MIRMLSEDIRRNLAMENPFEPHVVLIKDGECCLPSLLIRR